MRCSQNHRIAPQLYGPFCSFRESLRKRRTTPEPTRLIGWATPCRADLPDTFSYLRRQLALLSNGQNRTSTDRRPARQSQATDSDHSMKTNLSHRRFPFTFVIASLIALAGATIAPGQLPDTATVITPVDAAVKARIDNIDGYTATEHYAVYRGADEHHPVAEMTVNTTYRKDSGKSYAIVSQTGSEIIQSVVLNTILENERLINLPGTREGAWISSSNYVLTLKPGGPQLVDGRECLLLDMIPKRKAPYLIEGTLWVDARDGSIVQLQGTASKSSSFLTGATQVIRQYANVSGYPQATHVRAVSDSRLFGQTIVKIDYRDYRIEPRPPL